MSPLLPFIVALIGPPSVGKTKIGRILAETLGFDFIDLDDRIVAVWNLCKRPAEQAKSLQNVVDNSSGCNFSLLEESVVIATISMLTRPTIVATGGSVVYHRRAMETLRERSHVVYLQAPLETIVKRLNRPDKANRGLLFPQGVDTLEQLISLRLPMYEQYCHRAFRVDENRRDCANRLAASLREEGLICSTQQLHPNMPRPP